MGVGGQHHAPAALPPGKTRYPLYRRLGRPRAGLDGCGLLLLVIVIIVINEHVCMPRNSYNRKDGCVFYSHILVFVSILTPAGCYAEHLSVPTSSSGTATAFCQAYDSSTDLLSSWGKGTV